MCLDYSFLQLVLISSSYHHQSVLIITILSYHEVRGHWSYEVKHGGYKLEHRGHRFLHQLNNCSVLSILLLWGQRSMEVKHADISYKLMCELRNSSCYIALLNRKINELWIWDGYTIINTKISKRRGRNNEAETPAEDEGQNAEVKSETRASEFNSNYLCKHWRDGSLLSDTMSTTLSGLWVNRGQSWRPRVTKTSGKEDRG